MTKFRRMGASWTVSHPYRAQHAHLPAALRVILAVTMSAIARHAVHAGHAALGGGLRVEPAPRLISSFDGRPEGAEAEQARLIEPRGNRYLRSQGTRVTDAERACSSARGECASGHSRVSAAPKDASEEAAAVSGEAAAAAASVAAFASESVVLLVFVVVSVVQAPAARIDGGAAGTDAGPAADAADAADA
eukprot:CAMPEP_0119317306 /NCGR_PEP_ID=MMETSP1333-20130426/42705_1 /TAXON_ID=418940 /ORGANISM="Scyphosphaera apsteinii, Strain RCC1455" /LENGTH=190 /DNA_ID=CAMNT_0007323205 /DNA_START=719 /DNA_END=1288 /DNA_ORIENTATION=-